MTTPLGASHRTHVLVCFLDIHRRLAELEAEMVQATEPSPFSRIANDLSPTEAKVVQDHFARIRAAMLSLLQEFDIPLDVRQTSLRWSLQTRLNHVQVTIDEMGQRTLSGYGPLDPAGREAVLKIQQDLERLTGRVRGYLQKGLGRDLSQRLARLEKSRAGVATLSTLEKIVSRWKLVEFRPVLDMIVGRLEDPRFEIAVFGRVSSGKSSLLNHVAGIDALPVGVTPVTAVRTRLTYGETSSALVSFAEAESRLIGVEQLDEFAAEEGNPGNHKYVTGILVRLPSSRLRDGVIFVDTPGVGSLALEGGAESLAYLPRCDLGIVLIDAATTLDQEDLDLLQALYEAGIPAMVLLSKADLVTESDRRRMVDYIREHVRRRLGLDLPVQPVSTVGSDELLLTQWFEREIRPLMDRHRSLVESSLRRKIASVRESVSTALELLMGRGGSGPGTDSGIDPATVRRLLDEADAAVRDAMGCSQDWSRDRHALWEQVPDSAARSIVATLSPESAGDEPIIQATRDTLTQRDRLARRLITRLKQDLGRSLDGLRRVAAPLAAADVALLDDVQLGGLLAHDLGRLGGKYCPSRPWWATLVPGLAVRSIRNGIGNHLGSLIREVVELHDRQVQAWIRSNVNLLVESYETQAAPVREQVRRVLTNQDRSEDAGDRDQLESDLRELQQTADARRELRSASTKDVPPRVGL